MEIEVLILKLKKKEKGAWKMFVDMYGKKVLNYIYGFVGVKETAEELTQEVFFRVYRNIDKIETKKELFEGFIFRVARNLTIDEWRKISKRKNLSEETYTSSSEEDYSITDLVWRALERLPDDLKSIIILREFDGYSYDEISKIEGIPIGTVKSKLNRAKLQLAEKVRELQEGKKNG